MSYDLAVWEGVRPSDDVSAAAIYERIVNELEAGDPATPTAPIVAYVSALLERWPDITTEAGDDSPWADGPMIANASGSWIYFSMVWSRAEEASRYAADLAARQGLVCFDPQTERLRPATVQPATTRRRWWSGRDGE
ncbi:hypothetical protein ACXR2U_18590 [Jatrophihabitans sp. YIM 134969]